MRLQGAPNQDRRLVNPSAVENGRLTPFPIADLAGSEARLPPHRDCAPRLHHVIAQRLLILFTFFFAVFDHLQQPRKQFANLF